MNEIPIEKLLPQGLQDMLSAQRECMAQANDIHNEIIDREMKTLHLPLKAKWYEMIDSGVKTEEYRILSSHWVQRLLELANGTFEISGEDLLKIHALLQDKEITHLLNVRRGCYCTTIDNYIFIGKDVEKKRIMDMYVKLLYNVEEINNTRHWWERKIKIDSEL